MATLDIFSETTQKNILDELKVQNSLVKIIASGWNIDSWKAVQEIVRGGGAPRYLPIGTQLQVAHARYGTLLLDVVDLDNPYLVNPDSPADHNMVLMMHDVIYGQAFDAREALYAVNADTWASGLPVGTYYFTLRSGYDTSYGGGKPYYFTTTKVVPVGGCICFAWGWNTQASTCKITTYDAMGNLTALETLSVTEGSEGTNLGTADGKTAHMNYTDVMRYGYGDYAYSNIRQWLNSDLASGWWTQAHEFDRPSSVSSAGFLNGMDEEFVSVVGAVDVQTNINTMWNIDGKTSGARTTRDKFWLASCKEIGLGTDGGYVTWGDVLGGYKDATNADRIKYDYSNKSTARCWWLRSPHPWSASSARIVYTSGALNADTAYNGDGAVAACVIY